MQQRRYFSERHGRGPRLNGLPFETVRRLVMEIVARFDADGYLQEAFGYRCVDDGLVPGRLGTNPESHFLLTIHREGVWPYDAAADEWNTPQWESWNEDTVFDVIEVLHDVVSRPVRGRYHDYYGCGWHYEEFDREAGQHEFRDELNRVLPLGEVPLEMDAAGQVIERGPSELHQLIEAEVPDSADDDLVKKKIAGAVARFRSRGADNDDRRVAVRELADVLEALRPQVKELMLPRDERDLFFVANRFSIRHNARDQRRDYDSATWLSWAFYVYLATIHAVLRILERQAKLTRAA
jgi:hypothetical protein